MKPIRLTVNYPCDGEEDLEFSTIDEAIEWLRQNRTWSSYMIIGTNL